MRTVDTSLTLVHSLRIIIIEHIQERKGVAMIQYTLKDLKVRRVILCLSSSQRRSEKEVADIYNRHYPPNIFKRIVGFKMSVLEIQYIINTLLEHKLVEEDLLSFTDQYLEQSTKHFVLSEVGIRFLKNKMQPP